MSMLGRAVQSSLMARRLALLDMVVEVVRSPCSHPQALSCHCNFAVM